MGKIRVKALGDEELEKQQAEEAKKRSAAKKAEKTEDTEESVKLGDAKPTEEVKEVAKPKKMGSKDKRARHSSSYQSVASLVDHNKIYNLSEALEILPKLKRAKFDETVELHINTTTTGINGSMTLPHGTGKEVKVAVADDALIAEVEKGNIDFDILLAEPQMMPKLAKVARVLGPRGLMPNPKNGTVTPNPTEAAKKYQGGMMNYKTEAKFPLLHLRVGKVSFEKQKLAENIKTAVQTVEMKNIKNATLKSTMSPGIRLDVTTV